MAENTINLPQLLIIVLLGGLAIRYFFFSPSSNTPASSRGSAINVRAREADVERIQQMFPQVPRRSIMWDLQRNGGNVVATTERVLSGRGLEVPPQSFQPPLPTPSSSSAASPVQPKSLQPDLITRYNLKSKIAEEANQQESVPTNESEKKQGNAWSANKGERQALLQRRREEMILQARRKMEAKVRAESTAGTEGTAQGS